MNILPIPALDGGHAMFLMYEIITGRKANDKVLEYAQVIGFIFLITLVIYANGNVFTDGFTHKIFLLFFFSTNNCLFYI